MLAASGGARVCCSFSASSSSVRTRTCLTPCVTTKFRKMRRRPNINKIDRFPSIASRHRISSKPGPINVLFNRNPGRMVLRPKLRRTIARKTTGSALGLLIAVNPSSTVQTPSNAAAASTNQKGHCRKLVTSSVNAMEEFVRHIASNTLASPDNGRDRQYRYPSFCARRNVLVKCSGTVSDIGFVDLGGNHERSISGTEHVWLIVASLVLSIPPSLGRPSVVITLTRPLTVTAWCGHASHSCTPQKLGWMPAQLVPKGA